MVRPDLLHKWPRALIFPIALVIVLFVASACVPRTFTLRYRLAVSVETPGGTRSGSSVLEATYDWPFWDRFFGIGERKYTVTGESVVVRLDDGRDLLVLVTSDFSKSKHGTDASRLPIFVYQLSMKRERIEEELKKVRKVGTVDISPEMLPTMVVFADAADPKSVKLVDPADLSAALGVGYSFKRAFIEPTDAPLTDILESELPWLRALNGSDPPLSQNFADQAENPLLRLQRRQFKARNGLLP
ncbi:hypothetical protein RFM99_07790 [Mesorhizobium sp. VK4C]|uniref:hypothetical protein n=1 Tax=Mesorhizobium captivum TaxID=3072319 RepID=UPI002A244911|nr:hypothetical protein [Mesorhizobium sp. VK4C]MDX8498319.1 hypothetical protein [Mesorhizobium sp. VK4C]